MLRGAVSRAYAREQFKPSPLGLLLNPFYFARKGLHEQLFGVRHHVRGRVLDVGCGEEPYRSTFDPSNYVGLEIDTPANRARGTADAFYDGQTFPFAGQHFDCVFYYSRVA